MFCMSGMQVYLDVDAFPAFAMHRVIGGEEDVSPRDRHVTDVVEIPASTPGPRAAELAGGDRHLVCLGAYDGIERRRRLRCEIRRYIAELGERDLAREPVLSP